MDILNKSKNFYRCVGSVYEMGGKDEKGNPVPHLVRQPCEVKLYENGKATGETVKAECIKGSLAVRIGDGIVTFMIYFASKGLDLPCFTNFSLSVLAKDTLPSISPCTRHTLLYLNVVR